MGTRRTSCARLAALVLLACLATRLGVHATTRSATLILLQDQDEIPLSEIRDKLVHLGEEDALRVAASSGTLLVVSSPNNADNASTPEVAAAAATNASESGAAFDLEPAQSRVSVTLQSMNDATVAETADALAVASYEPQKFESKKIKRKVQHATAANVQGHAAGKSYTPKATGTLPQQNLRGAVVGRASVAPTATITDGRYHEVPRKVRRPKVPRYLRNPPKLANVNVGAYPAAATTPANAGRQTYAAASTVAVPVAYPSQLNYHKVLPVEPRPFAVPGDIVSIADHQRSAGPATHASVAAAANNNNKFGQILAQYAAVADPRPFASLKPRHQDFGGLGSPSEALNRKTVPATAGTTANAAAPAAGAVTPALAPYANLAPTVPLVIPDVGVAPVDARPHWAGPSAVDPPQTRQPPLSQYTPGQHLQSRYSEIQPLQSQYSQIQPLQSQYPQIQPLQTQYTRSQPLQAQPKLSEPETYASAALRVPPVKTEPLGVPPLETEAVRSQSLRAESSLSSRLEEPREPKKELSRPRERKNRREEHVAHEEAWRPLEQEEERAARPIEDERLEKGEEAVESAEYAKIEHPPIRVYKEEAEPAAAEHVDQAHEESHEAKKDDHDKDEGDHHFEKGGGAEHHAEHHGHHEEEGEEGYKSFHEHDESEKGHHDKENHAHHYDEKDGKEKKHHEEGGYHGEHHEGEKGHKDAEFAEKGEHQKGHSTKGQHFVHKKDEYEKKTEFFDEFDEDGGSEKEGEFHHEHEHKEGGHEKKGHHDGAHHLEKFGKEAKHAEGHHYHEHKGHKADEGHGVHHDHEEKHGKKDGHEEGHKYHYKKGDDGKGHDDRHKDKGHKGH